MALAAHGFDVCSEVGDAEAAVREAVECRPDICLLDVNMPGGGGVAAAREIHRRLPETKIVMLTVSRNDDDLFASLKAGALGYLIKDMDAARLPHALRGVLDGEGALPRALAMRLVDEFRSREGRRPLRLGGRGVSLSEREWEVLDALRRGEATAEIAAALDISEVTVRRHVSRILAKLRAPDRAAAVRLADEATGGPDY